jgi:peptide/nickel transport system permease protein
VAQAVIKRLLVSVPILFGMSVIVLLILRLVPGDPVYAILGLNATPALVAQLHHQLHLSDPIYVQYLDWISRVLRGDFGYDYRSGQPITQLVGQTLPVTLELVVLALLLAILVGVPIGMLAAVRRGRSADKVALVASLLGISVPDFWLGIVLILALALRLGLFPASGFVPLTEHPLQNLWYMSLPALALSAAFAAVLIRITRAAMLDVLNQDFIRFTRARGISERAVILRHALRNAAIPIVTVIGMQAGYIVGGTIVIEQLFALPGLGNLLLNATLQRNYPIVQAGVLILGVTFVLANLTADMLYIILNPTLRTEAE